MRAQSLYEDRESMRILHRLDDAATEWQSNSRDPAFLYRGSRLAQAEEWLEAHSSELSELPLANAFLNESIAQANGRTRTAGRKISGSSGWRGTSQTPRRGRRKPKRSWPQHRERRPRYSAGCWSPPVLPPRSPSSWPLSPGMRIGKPTRRSLS